MVAQITTLDVAAVIGLCEAGRYSEARESLPPLGDDPLTLLAYGMVETATGSQEQAKDYLFKAVELFHSKCYSDRARIQLALAYWRGGEMSEARAVLRYVRPSFEYLLVKAIICPSPHRALKFLDQAASYKVSAGMEGRLHNQRAMVLRQLNETDRAIQEYEAAKYCFEQSGSNECLAYVCNNLARIYSVCKKFDEAHDHVDRAISLLTDAPHRAKVLDEKAQIYLQQEKYDEARGYAQKAIKTIITTEYKGWLVECLITHGLAIAGTGSHCQALDELDRAEQICVELDNKESLFEVVKTRLEILQQSLPAIDRRLVELALEISDGSYRGAAQKIGISHPSLLNKVKKYGLRN